MGSFSLIHWIVVIFFISIVFVAIFSHQKYVTVKHTHSGLVKKGFYGFSKTYFIFGWWVPLFRGEIGIAALHLLFTALTFGIWQLIASFIYNKQYTSRLLTNGWQLADDQDKENLARLALGMAQPGF